MKSITRTRLDWLAEMERFRTADLGDLTPDVAFHFGYAASTIYELLNHIENLEMRLEALERKPINLGPF